MFNNFTIKKSLAIIFLFCTLQSMQVYNTNNSMEENEHNYIEIPSEVDNTTFTQNTSKDKETILVTGGNGYVGSWIVLKLLERGYNVHTTVRNKKEVSKISHLVEMGNKYPGRLKIFEADLLKEGSFEQSMKDDVSIVIHTAAVFINERIKKKKVEDYQAKIIDPTVKGVKNVLNTCKKHPKIKKVILTSSYYAMSTNASEIQNKKLKLNEDLWNDSALSEEEPYAYAKTQSEKIAKDMAHKAHFKLISINPGAILGPSLSKRTDFASFELLNNFLEGVWSSVPEYNLFVVDVRDIAEAHIKAAILDTKYDRYLAISKSLSLLEIAQLFHFEESFFGKKDALILSKRIPKKIVSKSIFLLFGTKKHNKKYFKKNIGVKVEFDTKRIETDLGIRFTDPARTINEHAKQMYKDGLINMGKK